MRTLYDIRYLPRLFSNTTMRIMFLCMYSILLFKIPAALHMYPSPLVNLYLKLKGGGGVK